MTATPLAAPNESPAPRRRRRPSAGRFTPIVDTAGLPDALREPLAVAADLAEQSLADNTKGNLDSHWGDWERHCAAIEADASPADPRVLAAYLAVLAAKIVDGQMAVDEEGRPERGRLRPQTITQRVSAINRWHRVKGLDEPGKDPFVQAVLAGIRRTFLIRAENAKAALDMPLMRRLLDAAAADTEADLRDRAIAVLHHRLDAGPGQMARLALDGVVFVGRRAVVALPRASRTTRTDSATITATGGRNCPVAILRAFADARLASPYPAGTFLVNDAGRPMSRQGIRAALRRTAPTSSPADELAAGRTLVTLGSPRPEVVRDRALLLTGWWAALRRSNITALNWGDLRNDGGEWEVLLRFAKTDQHGVGEINWLVRTDSLDWPCPAAAMSAWHAFVTRLLGGDPCKIAADQPVFAPIDRHGNVGRTSSGRLRRMSTDAVCRLVQRHAASAGLVAGDFGAHSLRAGFVTEALTDNKLSFREIQDVTKHKHIESVVIYDRPRRGDSPTGRCRPGFTPRRRHRRGARPTFRRRCADDQAGRHAIAVGNPERRPGSFLVCHAGGRSHGRRPAPRLQDARRCGETPCSSGSTLVRNHTLVVPTIRPDTDAGTGPARPSPASWRKRC